MSESNGCPSPQLQLIGETPPEGSQKATPEKRRFDEGMSPVSPRESKTPSSPEQSPSTRHSRHHRRHHVDRKREQRKNRDSSGFGRSERTREEEQRQSERKRRRSAYEMSEDEVAIGTGGIDETGKRSRHRGSDYKSAGKSKNEIVEVGRQERERHRRDRRRQSTEKGEEALAVERKSSSRKYIDERESRHHSSRGQEVKSKRTRRRSGSQHSLFRVALPFNGSKSSSAKHLNPFVSTLLKLLFKEETSDTELEDLLPAGILSGEMAKRSMPLSVGQAKKMSTSQPSQPQNQVLKSQEPNSKQSPNQVVATAEISQTAGSNQSQRPIDEGESYFGKFLLGLSDRLQEKEQEPESWVEREINFSDILTEDVGPLRLAASSVVLKPKQLLESSLSTPWQKITEQSPEEAVEEEEGEKEKSAIKTDAEIAEDKEDSLNLVALLSSSISRRFLDDRLVRQLEELGIPLLPVTAGFSPADSKDYPLGMVPTIFEEISWRHKLLGVLYT